ncbi:MAG: hypothetical protein Q8R85_06990 [Bosea sp. (in: a-proteobacteria)]|uniref:hypothetical protein n=1 Tax=Bosea sp. (in: a-proteobacteria) TaxID=1871050 RepID=UPI002733D94F|nr:hypothetical protein [Bosea sp. (in: a-proteobacteria)]MDP3600892.1 hypothetical protein [Bosea sp. (in: a-proteobacteria)]
MYQPISMGHARSIIRDFLAKREASRNVDQNPKAGTEGSTAAQAQFDRGGDKPDSGPSVPALPQPPVVHDYDFQPEIVLTEGSGQNRQLEHFMAPSGDDGCEDDDDAALLILLEGLIAGAIDAAVLDDISAVPVPAGYWATEAGRKTVNQGYRLVLKGGQPSARYVKQDVIVSEDDVVGLMGGATSRNRGGRKPKYEWGAIVHDIWNYATQHGLPQTKAQFYSNIAIDLGHRAPLSETQLKERTDRVFDALSQINRRK